jgi:hypothetical protein
MKHYYLILILFSTAFIGGCSKSNIIDPELLKGDWRSPVDDRPLFIEDSMVFQYIIWSSAPSVKYKVSHDSLFIYTKDPDNLSDSTQSGPIWKYKILHIDSSNLTLFRFFPRTDYDEEIKDTLFFKRLGGKKNNIKIKELELYASGCCGLCPPMNIKIMSDSSLYLYGFNSFSKHKGLHYYKLNPIEFSRIQNKLNAIERDSIHFGPKYPDAVYYKLFIRSEADSIKAEGTTDANSRSMNEFIGYMVGLDELLNLKPCNDKSISFREKRN